MSPWSDQNTHLDLIQWVFLIEEDEETCLRFHMELFVCADEWLEVK